MDSDSDLLFKTIADSESSQLEGAIWKAVRTAFQVNHDELDILAKSRRPIYRDDDPKYLIQFRADISNLGQQKKFKNDISMGSTSSLHLDILSSTNTTTTTQPLPKLKSVGRKKSWKSPFRSNELQRNINFLHNLNATMTHHSGGATAVAEAIYLDVDGLVAASLIQKAAMIIDKEFPIHSVSSSTSFTSGSSRAAASLSSCVRAIFTSASRVTEPAQLLISLDRTKQGFIRILRHCVRYADLKSAILLLAAFYKRGNNYDAEVSQLTFALMDIGIRRGLFMDSAILFSVTRTSCNGSDEQLQCYERQGSIAHLRSLLQLHLVDNDVSMEADLSTKNYRGSGSISSSSTNKDTIRANILACTSILQLLRTTRSSGSGDETILLKNTFEQEMVHILLDNSGEGNTFRTISDVSSNTEAVSSFHTDVLDTLYMAMAEENRRIFLLAAATAIKIGISLTDEDITVIGKHLQ